MRIFFTLLLLIVITEGTHAEPVKLSQARSAAIQFLSRNFVQTKASLNSIQLIWSDAGLPTKSGEIQINPTVYVFNITEGEGFVIVSGDDSAYPIIGYSDHFGFRSSDLPANIKAWFTSYSEQISWMRTNKIQPSLLVSKAWKDLSDASLQFKSGGGVLLETALWDQEAPYNNLCPTISGQKAPTGCVATSTSIVMKYYAWPEIGQGSFSYTTETNRIKLSANFNTTYNWTNMPMTYLAGQYTTSQANNVATLMFDVGVFSQMDYNTDGSGALTLNAAIGLVNYMKYDKSLQVLERQYYQTDEWVSMIMNELDNSRPVIYGGQNAQNEGHQFVLDGYNTENYFHVNWGWSGSANGYYLLDVLEPQFQGTGGNIGGFSLSQDAMFNVKPAQSGSAYQDVLAFFSGTTDGNTFKGITTTSTQILANKAFTITAGFVGNLSIRDFSGDLVVALTDQDGVIKELISDPVTVSISVYNGIARDFPCTITKSIVANDQIRLMYKSKDATDWQWVRGGGDTSGYITISNPTSNVAISPSDESIRIALIGNEELQIVSAKPIQYITIYDIAGRLIKKSIGNESTSVVIPLQNYNKGFYLIEVLAQDDRAVQKIVKH